MPRAYDVRVVALTTNTSAKWVDNLLSHHALPGVEKSRQGVQRQITDDGVLAIALVRCLTRSAGFGTPTAVGIVCRALEARRGSDVVLPLAPGVALRIDVSLVEQDLRERLADAIDAAPRVRRGRPRLERTKETPDA